MESKGWIVSSDRSLSKRKTEGKRDRKSGREIGRVKTVFVSWEKALKRRERKKYQPTGVFVFDRDKLSVDLVINSSDTLGYTLLFLL
jgi:hypothetical protein